VLGQDPFDRERLYQAMWQKSRQTTLRAIGAMDIALWDIAGKIAGLPIHKLLGSYRTSVPAYASSAVLPSKEAYGEEAARFKADGWTAYKIHPPTDPAVESSRQRVLVPVEASPRPPCPRAAHSGYWYAHVESSITVKPSPTARRTARQTSMSTAGSWWMILVCRPAVGLEARGLLPYASFDGSTADDAYAGTLVRYDPSSLWIAAGDLARDVPQRDVHRADRAQRGLAALLPHRLVEPFAVERSWPSTSGLR